ncbi:MAG TPA: hypothetical protein VFW23_10065 [Tepidisphaeraceae bacterium]|nr:hypothetical protein [Tepidisphaeraceae bacterium]
MSMLSLPILAIPRTAGKQVLSGYKLTPDEQKLLNYRHQLNRNSRGIPVMRQHGRKTALLGVAVAENNLNLFRFEVRRLSKEHAIVPKLRGLQGALAVDYCQRSVDPTLLAGRRLERGLHE